LKRETSFGSTLKKLAEADVLDNKVGPIEDRVGCSAKGIVK
jgi:hypothetical protein